MKTKKDARDIAEKLKKRGFNVISLRDDMTQKQRVVATNVASRGLDIRGVSFVINYYMPTK